MRPVLLAFLPEMTWWLGIAITIVIALITHLVNRNLKAKDERLQQQDERIKELETEVSDLRKASITTNEKINEVNMRIYTDINIIKISLAEVRILLTK